MISFEVRNSRGTTVHTFGDASSALRYAKAYFWHYDGLDVYAVENIRRERLLTVEPEVAPVRIRKVG